MNGVQFNYCIPFLFLQETMMKLLESLLKKEDSVLEQEFIAPVFENNDVIVKFMGGFVYQFKVSNFQHEGYFKLKPTDYYSAEIQRVASPKEVQQYQKPFPQYMAVVVGRDKKNKLLGMIEPHQTIIPVLLTRDELSMFDAITVCYDGLRYYKVHKGYKDSRKQTNRLLEALTKEIHPDKIGVGITNLHEDAYRWVYGKTILSKKKTKTEEIKELVNNLGGRVSRIQENNRGFMIRFEVNGEEFSPVVDKDLRLVSAGICLSGTDNIHDLSSFVSVAREGINRGLIYRV